MGLYLPNSRGDSRPGCPAEQSSPTRQKPYHAVILSGRKSAKDLARSTSTLPIASRDHPQPTGRNPPILATLSPMSSLRQVVVYSRKGCHLCEIVKETLTKLHRRGGFTWQDIDVDADEQLRRQFTDEVPVVFIDGRKAFKYRMDESDFLRKLAR